MNIPHDPSCHEGSKNVYFIEVRNLEGQNHPGHIVGYIFVYENETVPPQMKTCPQLKFSYLHYLTHDYFSNNTKTVPLIRIKLFHLNLRA